MEYIIDASGKSLGRVASQAAIILMGKNSPKYRKNVIADNKVLIKNVSKVKISGKKIEQKKYKSYSGYPGGLKESVMSEVISKKGHRFVVQKAVCGMLPKNKSRRNILKNLVIEN